MRGAHVAVLAPVVAVSRQRPECQLEVTVVVVDILLVGQQAPRLVETLEETQPVQFSQEQTTPTREEGVVLLEAAVAKLRRAKGLRRHEGGLPICAVYEGIGRALPTAQQVVGFDAKVCGLFGHSLPFPLAQKPLSPVFHTQP